MRVFDRMESASVEKREFQLAILSLVCIVIFSVGLVLFMYPAVVERPLYFSVGTTRILFFSFCGLSLLLFGYLLDRQLVVRRLRREITIAQMRYSQLRVNATEDLLQVLPGRSRFQDRLSMEFKRSVNCGDPLSVVVIVLKPAASMTDPADVMATLGDAVKAISRKIRSDESLHNFLGGAFGIILPGKGIHYARLVAARISDGLNDAAGAANRFTFEIKVFNYPQDVRSAHELKEAVASLLPGNSAGVASDEYSRVNAELAK